MREKLITDNLGLVHSVARRYQGRGVAFDDLVQEGTVGLLQAADRFDAGRGAKFSTYAIWWIRRAIVDALGEGRAIRIPRSARRQMAAIYHAQNDLRTSGTGAPSDDDIAERTGISPRTVHALRAAPYVSVSLDEPVGGDATPLRELVADDTRLDAPDPDPETLGSLRAMLAVLPARHRDILLRRYGLSGDEPQSLEEIGASLGLGRERARQLERQALQRLREMVNGVDLAA
jgi:DNA-directed RNA polymerase sigma subunit (sigma70/sigma32)